MPQLKPLTTYACDLADYRIMMQTQDIDAPIRHRTYIYQLHKLVGWTQQDAREMTRILAWEHCVRIHGEIEAKRSFDEVDHDAWSFYTSSGTRIEYRVRLIEPDEKI